ncbi:MAG TPA: DNA alkylation repair protein [Actinopolymorphaceae bacterium]
MATAPTGAGTAASSRAVVEQIRERLARAGDPDKAPAMQAYMKSTLPFRGVPALGVASICREVFAAHRIDDRAVWEATVRELFDAASYREERYAALALTGHRSYRGWQDPSTLELYDHLVVTGAWWDFVDEIASRRVGPILRAHSGTVGPVLRRWARDPNLWRRRTAILAQLQSKEQTDTDLLADCLAPSLDSTEFFLRKAIGWALRQYARVAPDWVRAYVRDHDDRLSTLSKREATKHLGAKVSENVTDG